MLTALKCLWGFKFYFQMYLLVRKSEFLVYIFFRLIFFQISFRLIFFFIEIFQVIKPV